MPLTPGDRALYVITRTGRGLAEQVVTCVVEAVYATRIGIRTLDTKSYRLVKPESVRELTQASAR